MYDRIEHKVLQFDAKGNLSQRVLGDTTFVGEDAFERAMDTRNYLGEDFVVVTHTSKDRTIIRKDMRHHYILLTTNSGTDTQSYTVFSMITNGDGFGREVYGSSKSGYKTVKGALKTIKKWMSW